MRDQIDLESKVYEQRISDSFDYMQHHAGGMIMSGIKSFINPKSEDGSHSSSGHSGGLNFASLAKGLILPVAFSVAQPLLISWGIGKVPMWIINFLIKRWKRK